MAYGPSFPDLFRRAPYVGNILKDANPAELPVEQPTKINLVINFRTARALGLTIPQSVLQQATDIIQLGRSFSAQAAGLRQPLVDQRAGPRVRAELRHREARGGASRAAALPAAGEADSADRGAAGARQAAAPSAGARFPQTIVRPVAGALWP